MKSRLINTNVIYTLEDMINLIDNTHIESDLIGKTYYLVGTVEEGDSNFLCRTDILGEKRIVSTSEIVSADEDDYGAWITTSGNVAYRLDVKEVVKIHRDDVIHLS